MRVLVACELSGTVRDAFRRRGHDAVSADLLPSEAGGPHIQGDIRDVIEALRRGIGGWELVIAHPPCTYLASSGLHWNKRRPERQQLTEDAAEFFMLFANLDCNWAIENPIGCMSTRFRKPDQIIQPHQFGHDASKNTCLWLRGLPPLRLGMQIAPRMVDGRPRWANQTDSGQNRLGPSEARQRIRSKTYVGIAEAMAEQWGNGTNQESLFSGRQE